MVEDVELAKIPADMPHMRDARGAGQVRAALAEAGASTQPLRRGGRRRWIRDAKLLAQILSFMRSGLWIGVVSGLVSSGLGLKAHKLYQ